MSNVQSELSGPTGKGGPLVVVGDVATDIVCAPTGPWRVGSDTDATISIRAGGSAANTSAWAAFAAAANGKPAGVAFVGRVGRDDAEWHRHLLTEVGVDARLVVDDDVATTRLVALIDGVTGERTMLTDRGAGMRLAPADVDETLIASSSWVHLSGYLLFAPSPQATYRHIVEICRANGVPWSVDPASAGYLADLGLGTARELLSGASIGFPNAEEALLLAGLPSNGEIYTAACALTELWATVVVKLGAKGAIVARGGSVADRAEARAVPLVVDAVGAGDAFAGGWLSAQLGGAKETQCLTIAMHTAATALRLVGGRPNRTTM